MKLNKVIVFGCKSTTKILIENINKSFDIKYIVTISAEIAHLNHVADYVDFKNNNLDKKIYVAEKYSLSSAADLNFFKKHNFDIAFVVGWQRLIPKDVLSTFSVGVFGMHGSAMNLPLGRGRSPMNWALIEGRNQFYTNLFKYDPGIDSGDVLDTHKFQIRVTDNAETLHFKNTLSMIYLINRNYDKFKEKKIKLLKQNKDLIPTYYPKRSPSDSLIDWTSDVYQIDRFIRAVHPPFNGAYTFLNDKVRCEIIDACVFDFSDFDFGNEKYSTIVQVFPNGKFLVKCFGGLLLISKFNCDSNIKKGDFFDNSSKLINYFEINKKGGYDHN